MHMTDAMLSPAVGGIMMIASTRAVGHSVKKLTGDHLDEKKIPLMGVMGAFIFAGQMVNFTIPGTGSSGHIGGGILLAALLGPFPALLTLSVVLLIQCLFFADGGLLAYGCNVFNIGICSCLLAYQFFYKPIIRRGMNKRNITAAAVVSVVLGLQMGAFCVVMEVVASGVTELPFGAFALLMQPIHLAIGIIEGLVTAAVLCYVHGVHPEILDGSVGNSDLNTGITMKKVVPAFLVMTVLAGVVMSQFASVLPDGLEWSVETVAGTVELEREGVAYDVMGEAVDILAIMPGYTFSDEDGGSGRSTALAGIVGSAITIILAGGIGFMIHAARKKTRTG